MAVIESSIVPTSCASLGLRALFIGFVVAFSCEPSPRYASFGSTICIDTPSRRVRPGSCSTESLLIDVEDLSSILVGLFATIPASCDGILDSGLDNRDVDSGRGVLDRE
jgi:hypothetical protein